MQIEHCKKCKDTGKADNRRCECFMEIVKRAAAEEMKQKLVKAKALVENQSNDEALCLIDEIIENN